MAQPGQKATNFLENLTTVSDGQTVTIGADVYEVEVVNTSSGNTTAGGDFNNTTDPLTVVNAVTTYGGVTFAVGVLIRIENEILRVSVVAGNNVTFLRGQSNTTTATHANGNTIFKGNGVTGSHIAVGLVVTLTASAFVDAIVDDINGVGTEPFSAIAIFGGELTIYADAVGSASNGVTCSDTLTGGTWAGASTFGGSNAGTPTMSFCMRAVTAAEADAGEMSWFFDYSPTQVVSMTYFNPSVPGVNLGWDGDVIFAAGRVLLNDVNSVNWTVGFVMSFVVS
jgi:hypothetical protein